MDIHHFFSFEDFFQKKLFQNASFLWEPLSLLDDYLTKMKETKNLGEISLAAFISKGALVSLGKDTIVEPGAYIEGICVAGHHTRIRSGSYIRGNVLIGDNCMIGHGTEIKHSIILNRTSIPHFSYVGDSILGNDVNLGAGTICSNLRLDGEEISIRVDGKKQLTGMRKFGAIIGDGVKTGCKCVLNPGTVIGRDSHVYPGLILSGSYSEKSLIKK